MPKCSYCWKNEVEDYVYQEKMMCDECVEATSQPFPEPGEWVPCEVCESTLVNPSQIPLICDYCLNN